MSAGEIYNACIYARLSRDDGDKVESDSITNQRALIRDFIAKHEIRLKQALKVYKFIRII